MAEWTEERIAALPREDNQIERKASRLLNDENLARKELAKQLSAFANTGGGAIVLGTDDTGEIDGGPKDHGASLHLDVSSYLGSGKPFLGACCGLVICELR